MVDNNDAQDNEENATGDDDDADPSHDSNDDNTDDENDSNDDEDADRNQYGDNEVTARCDHEHNGNVPADENTYSHHVKVNLDKIRNSIKNAVSKLSRGSMPASLRLAKELRRMGLWILRPGSAVSRRNDGDTTEEDHVPDYLCLPHVFAWVYEKVITYIKI